MIYLVSIAVRQDYDLVDDDYYQKSVNYQQHIEEVKNTAALPEKIRLEQTDDSLKLTFQSFPGYLIIQGIFIFIARLKKKEMRPSS